VAAIMNARAKAELELDEISFKHQTEVQRVSEIFQMKNPTRIPNIMNVSSNTAPMACIGTSQTQEEEKKDERVKEAGTSRPSSLTHNDPNGCYDQNETFSLIKRMKLLLTKPSTVTDTALEPQSHQTQNGDPITVSIPRQPSPHNNGISIMSDHQTHHSASLLSPVSLSRPLAIGQFQKLSIQSFHPPPLAFPSSLSEPVDDAFPSRESPIPLKLTSDSNTFRPGLPHTETNPNPHPEEFPPPPPPPVDLEKLLQLTSLYIKKKNP
jgi:hypothetical protein